MKAKDKTYKLTLEINEKFIDGDKNKVLLFGKIPAMITPALDEDYWQFRVKVSDEQAIVGFPKFHSIGIGFAKEDDWNTNLPSTYNTNTIWEHIKVNKYFASISDKRCLEAIKMVQTAAKEMADSEKEFEDMVIMQNEPRFQNEITGKILNIKEFKSKCKILKRSYMDTFTNSAFGTETKKREYCMLFGLNPQIKKYKYKFTFYAFTPEQAISKFYYAVRNYCLTGNKPNDRFDVFYVSDLDTAMFEISKNW